MVEQSPISTTEEMDLLRLGDGFIDMMQMSQFVDPFTIPWQDIDTELDSYMYDQSFTLYSQPSPTLDSGYLQDQFFLVSENPVTSFEEHTTPIIVDHTNKDFSVFGKNPTHSEDQIEPESPPEPCQIITLESAETPVSLPGSQKKRKFEDGVSQFVGVEHPSRKMRQRKPFEPERRKEVDQVRKVGACIRCRITRSRVRNSSTSFIIR